MKDKKPSTSVVEKNNPDDKSSETREQGKALKKKLLVDFPNLWDKSTEQDRDQVTAFASEYKTFLNLAKTEREFVTVAIETLENMGFVALESLDTLKPGDKVYKSIRDRKSVV